MQRLEAAGHAYRLRNRTCSVVVGVQEKIAYLRAQAEMELKSAQQRLEQLEQQAAAARQAFTLHLDAAAE